MQPQFITETHDGLRVLVVAGEIDISVQSRFRDALHAIDKQSPRVLIDFCKCSYFDTSAIAELWGFRKARTPYQHVSIAMPDDFGRRILRIARVDAMFPIVDCLHAA
jgi:anti-anti-sigma factor